MPLIVIVEYTEPLPGGSMDVAALGVTTGGPWLEYAGRVENPRNYMEDVALEELGLGFVRSMGLRVESGPCTGEAVLRPDRAPLFTPVGAVSAGLLTLFGLLAVWVARRRRGGWVRRFLFAAPLGVVAAFWLAVALYEVGVLSPFVAFPWWLLAVGVLLAALTPLTRRNSRDAHPAPVPGSGG